MKIDNRKLNNKRGGKTSDISSVGPDIFKNKSKNINKENASKTTKSRNKSLWGLSKNQIVLIAIGVVTTLGTIIGNNLNTLFPEDVCKKLKKREVQVETKIEYYKNKQSSNKDFEERTTSFEIEYATAELKNIQDSLKFNLCSN